MSPVTTVEQVFAAIQKVKADASAFCTNFFPVQRKLQGWIDQGELHGDFRQETAFFFRKDRDFRRFYFCAPNVATLQQGLSTLSSLKTEPMVTDVVGSEAALGELPGLLEA